MSGEAKFMADCMLGKLARWMRTLGYDVAYERGIGDDELLQKAIDEERMILTRDTLLLKRRRARGRSFFVEGDHVAVQLRQVTARFPISAERAFSRCLRCNEPLDELPKELAQEKVPPYVYSTRESFSICLRCGRVYWAGTHRERMEEDIERMLKG